MIEYKKHNHVATFTLNNPPVNVWTPQLHKEFYQHLRNFVSDDDVHVGILTGAGDRAFSAGDDIKTPRPEHDLKAQVQRHFQSSNEGEEPEYPGWEREILRMSRFKPIIGAVNGVCVGQGLVYLLMLTDIRIAASHAQIGFPEIAWGMGGAGGSTRLSRFIPHTAAMYMLLTGEKMSAQRALDYTLVNEVVEKQDLMPRALELAERIASHDPMAVRVEMEASYTCMDMSRADAMNFTTHLYRLQRTAAQSLPNLEEELAKNRED
jgi:enoyl-CoA hydratase/carnithine racemase